MFCCLLFSLSSLHLLYLLPSVGSCHVGNMNKLIFPLDMLEQPAATHLLTIFCMYIPRLRDFTKVVSWNAVVSSYISSIRDRAYGESPLMTLRQSHTYIPPQPEKAFWVEPESQLCLCFSLLFGVLKIIFQVPYDW